MRQKFDSLRVKIETKERFLKRLKYGDTHDSALVELLDLANKVEGKPTVSKPVSDKPDEIIKNW